MREKVLGIEVDMLGIKEAEKLIMSWIREDAGKLKQVVTAYSEFFVTAKDDKEFRKVMDRADLVTVDGISVLAAVKYEELIKDNNRGVWGRVLAGARVGLMVVGGKLGETVTGVRLFEDLCKIAGERRMKVYFLGGWNGVAERAARIALERFVGIRVEFDEGERWVGTDEERNIKVIKKINGFKPDILFVSYNPVKQEKWIAKHKDILKAKVAIGVGGTFDEFTGDLRRAPIWMQKSGLKWLWRLWLQPKRVGRIWKAVVVFPWLVFKEENKR